jgi:sugar phosphate isomerase/epimerase
MRFGISNLVFGQLTETTREAILGVSAICDFAPTVHYGSWENTPDLLPAHPYPAHATKICALQSLFFGVQGASLLKDEDSFVKLVHHHVRLVDLAASAEVPFLIYGSPGTRAGCIEGLTEAGIHSRIIQLADIAASKGVKLCFEVNSPKFGCEYLTTNAALLELLAVLAHPGLGLHLDVGQILEEGIDVVPFVKANLNALVHLHLSASDFTCEPERTPLYTEVLTVLRDADVDVDVVLEIQKLGDASEAQLIDIFQQLAAASAS